MTNRNRKNVYKKHIVRLLVVVAFLVLTCILSLDNTRVIAAENEGTVVTLEDTTIDYKVKSYDDISYYRTKDEDGNFTAPTLTSDELTAAGDTTPGEWLFAGWYTNKACTTALSSSVVYTEDGDALTGTYYAKFVSADVLSIKFQISADTDLETSEDTVLRCVSTVDSLQYKGIGLRLVRPDGTIGYMDNNKVNTRIKARTDVSVEAYNYSPKVMDTESEYFFSATEVIEKDNFSQVYMVKPFWVTVDGTTVYGVSRCTTVEQMVNRTSVYVPVKVDAEPTSSELVTGETSLSYVKYDEDGGYAHFSLSATIASLPSVTAYEITGTYNSEQVDTTYIYRNLNTKYEGTADETWYRAYYTENANEDEYVIATNADLYGFATLVNNTTETLTIESCTIYLASDVDANNGNLNAETATTTTPTGCYVWPKIGTGKQAARFTGTFDGQMHTISGVYYNGGAADSGLFADIIADTTLKNFRLTNSYIYGSTRTGSVAGRAYGGTIENVYSDAKVVYGNINAGGFVGRVDTSALQIKNCWFAGEMNSSKESVGGLIGNVYSGNVSIKNSLNTSNIKSTSNSKGGFIGNITSGCTASITNCLSVGTINTTGASVGAIAGANAGTLTATNVYAVGDDTTVVVAGVTTYTGVTTCALADISGTKAITADTKTLFTYLTDLSSDAYWAISEEAPVLASFAEYATDSDGNAISAIAIDMDWYKSYPNKSTYTLYDVADLYGFAYLSKIADVNGFEGRTIQLAADMVVNDDWTAGATAPTYTWPGIGHFSYVTNDDNTRTETSIPFKGNFDGQGHSISGVYMSNTDAYIKNVGLFRYVEGEVSISDFSLLNSYVSSKGEYVGGIAGQSSADMHSIYTDVIVEGYRQSVGGFVGRVYADADAQITNCWFDGTATNPDNRTNAAAGKYLGGFVGRNQGTLTFTCCLNSAEVSAPNYKKDNDPCVGGFVGTSTLNVEFYNCVNSGTVTASLKDSSASGTYAAFLGNGNAWISFNNAYALETSCTALYAASADDVDEENELAFKTSDEMTGTSALQSMNVLFTTKDSNTGIYENDWAVVVGSVPVLSTFTQYATADVLVPDTTWYDVDDSSYTLNNVADLYGFALLSKLTDVDGFDGKTITLGADIDVNEGWTAGSDAPTYQWIGIGEYIDDNNVIPFKGEFDGNNKELKGIYYNNTATKYGGLFRLVEGATIKNLSLTNSYVTSNKDFLGSITGQATSSSLEQIYSDATVKGSRQSIGGLIGRISSESAMSRCWYDGEVTNTGNSTSDRGTGGLVGRINDDTTITNCLNTADVSAETYSVTEKTDGTDNSVRPYVGGLIGFHNAGTLNLSYCLNTGEIKYNDAATIGYGAVVGRVNNSLTVNALAVYGTTSSCSTAVSITTSATLKPTITELELVNIVDAALIGDAAKETKLFATANSGVWSTVSNSTPVLACFADKATAGTEVALTNLQTTMSNASSTSAVQISTITSTITLTEDAAQEAAKTRQGGCYVKAEDGTFYYQAYMSRYYYDSATETSTDYNEDGTADNEDNLVVIVKYDLLTNKEVARSEELVLYHANDMTYNSKLNLLVVAHANDDMHRVSFIDPDTLEIVSTKYITGLSFYSIDYNATYDCYVVQTGADSNGNGHNLVILNGDMEIIAQYEDDTYPLYTDPRLYTHNTGAQGMGCDDQYIYCLFSSTTNESVITVFDWNGNYVTEIGFTIADEVETVSIVGNTIYVNVAGASTLYKIEF